ncbi:hypothetical protein IDM40_10015 [Nocardiopsis sp. HNM0947]|uniref:Integral membrane protein n=1 Tax=Nocardiopsis coralli TaxID=2772213 RepID=A0ABR9P599_9ACTN|nr:hypothetical protein [Nocardiopsis coralli]MBE2999032.1 hypothetical protein [Nocardiopsis coralli]
MSILASFLLFLHMIGLAGILAGVLMQLMTDNTKSVKVLLHSALLQLVSGILLVGVYEMADLADVNHMKIGIKLVIALAIVVVGFVNKRNPATKLAAAAGVLGVLNIGLAVFW